jgi:hypothetical protein
LLSFQNEKSEVLENLLSNKEQEVVELNKANPVRLEKSDYADLRLTPSDLKVIGMVTTSGTGPSSEMDETGYYTVETNSTNEFEGLLSTAEIGVHSSEDVFCTFGTYNTEVLDNVDRISMISSHERETGLKNSSKSIEPEPHCIYDQSRCTSETNFQGQPAVGEDRALHSDQHAQSGSVSLGISDAVDDSDHTKAGTNKKISCAKLFHINQNEPNETLKNLKQRIIQQFLKMGKNNLKDLINNPRSRKFEFAMDHLMKEHRLLLSRELRGLAQSRIRGQDVENQGLGEPVQETSSLLDTDIEINLSHLPQEVIEQLGSLLQLDLLDNAESMDFQPITVDTESSVHDLQNIQALQVALLSEENIKRAAVDSEIKPLDSGNTVDESEDERNFPVGHHRPDCRLSGSLINAGTGQTEEVLKGEMKCEQQVRLEESATAKKPRNESDKWPNYIPLAEGFMNSSVEFGNTFLEFPDYMVMSSTESEAVAGENRNVPGIPCIRKTGSEADQHLKLETEPNPAITSHKPLNQEVASEASEAHARSTYEMTDSDFSQEVPVMPREILNSKVDVHSNKHLSNTSQEKSIIKRFSTNCSSSCDIVESCSEEKWIDASQQDGFDSLHITTGDSIAASVVANDGQAKEMLEGSRDAVEQSEGSFIADGPVEGSEYSCEPLADNEEQLQGGAAADKSLEGSSNPKNILFADGINNLNASVSGIIGGMTVATDDTGPGENEIKAEDFKLSKENYVTSIIDRPSVPDNIKTNFNTSNSGKNLNLRINRNEGNSCSVEDETLNKETDRNQNESVDIDISEEGDFSSKAVGKSFVFSGDNAESTNLDDIFMSSKKIIHSATAEQNIHTNDTAEIVKSGFCNAAEIVPSGGIQDNVDGLPGVDNLSVAEDNSAVVESLVSDSGDNDSKFVTHVPVTEEAKKKAGDCLSIVKSHVLDKDGSTENSSLAAEVSVQFELSSSDVASNHETHDDIPEIHCIKVVVKTEKFDDDDAEDETSQIKEQAQHEATNDTSTVFPEPQHVDSLSQTQSSVICNPVREVTTVEVGIQAQLSEELDSYDVQKILQLIEKSHHLSPQLAKSLRDYFSSSKVTKEHDLSKLSNSNESVSANKFGTASVSKEKSPPYLIIRPLNSEDVQTSQGTSELLCSSDGMRPSFQGPALYVNKKPKKSRNQINLAKPDDISLELDRVQKVGGGSKDSEVSACVSNLAKVDTNNLNASIVTSTCIDGDQNDDGINPGNDVQESSSSSNNKDVFLKMLEIDREIQKLMETKLKLYTELQLCLTTDATCRHSPESTGLQGVSPTEVVSSHALFNKMKLGSISNTEQTDMDFLTISSNQSLGTSCTSDRAASASAPMVMLPVDLQNTCLSFPKQKPKECKKTDSTSVMKTSSQIRGEDSAVIHYSGHSGHSEILGGVGEAPSLKVELDQVASDGAGKVRWSLGPSLSDFREESHQPAKNSSSPKVVSLKKRILKQKRNVGKEGHSGGKKKQSDEQHKTGIAMENDSCRPVGSQEKEITGSKCESTIKKPVCADALIRSTVKELRSRNKLAVQRVGNIKCEQEFSQSGNDMGEDKKESVSPGRTKGLTKSNKQSETDSLTSCNTSARHSPRNRNVSKSVEQLSSQTGTRVPRNRGDAKTRSQKDVEIELEGVADTVCSKEKVQSSKGKSFINSDESEPPDCVSRVTRKRKLTVKTDVVDEYVADSQEEPTENKSRRSFSRSTSDSQEIQSDVVDENVAEMSTRRKGRAKIEQTRAVDEITLHARQLKKTVVSNSGCLLKGNNCDVQLSPEILTSAISSRTRQHIDVVGKRKSHEVESPPTKVQHLDPKLNSVQWNLQKCFVMVKPLAVEKIDNTNKPQEELTTANSLNKQIIQRSSNTSHELYLTDCAGSVKKGTEPKGEDLIHKLDKPSRLIFPEVEDHSSLHDPFEGIPSRETQWPEVSIEPNENITSSPSHLRPDSIVQSHLPGRLVGQCIVPQIAIQDENSISTLVSDTSDGEPYFARRNKHDEKTEAHLLTHSADGKDDWDRDSASSSDMAQEGGEGTNSKALKHKSSKKRKKDRKSDGVERLVFESHEGPVLDIKTVGRHVLAASEDGNVYCYSLKSGKFKRKFEGHNGAVTCLCVIECSNSNVNSESEASDTEQLSPDSFFTGSLDRHLRSFIFKTGELVKNPVDVGSSVQCMDHSCGIIYIGTQAGEVARFNIKTSSLIGEPLKIGRESVLTLKATKEGPRQVLIIGSRNKPIAVRDAATGLLLRTVCNNWSHTVYSIVRSASLVYCGTKTGTIPAFEFTSGEEVCRFQAAAGVVCLRVYNNLLFAGCYDGNIYVFSIHDKTQVACIAGPGKMLLCMDIVKNRIIAGSKDSNKLEAWMFPQGLRNHLKEAKHSH